MSILLLTAAQRADLLARYPHEGNDALAAEFKLTKSQLSQFACANFVKKTRATRSRLNNGGAGNGAALTQRLIKAIADAGKAGLSVPGVLSALPDVAEDRIRFTLGRLTLRGRLHRTGRKGQGRWFTSAAQAEAYNAALGTPVPRGGADAPVSIAPHRGPAHLPGEPDLSKAIQRPALAPAATQIATMEGLFSLLGPGRYLADAPLYVEAIISRRKAA